MKKLKKGLSLVLVLVMVFGLATNAFAWDTTYADNDQITYKEAVEAMSGMGIIDGKLDNLFDPAGNYTREEAAKVITYMLVGPETAEALKPSSTGFSDVDAGRWSAGYIAYAASKDIIVGWDGEFHPEDSLTRAQWLKMLLVALGYDPVEYGLEDNVNWEINAVTLAIDIGLITAKESQATFNRELAVSYAFKAMQLPIKGQNGVYVVEVDGSTYTFTSAAEAYAFMQMTNGAVVMSTTNSLGAKVYNLESETVADEFGRTSKVWRNSEDEKDVYAENPAEPALCYSNKAVKVEDAEKALGEDAEIAKVYVNGEMDAEVPETLGNLSTEVEIYLDDNSTTDDIEYTAVVMELKVMKIDEDALEIDAFADFEEGDVVTYFQGKDGDKNVYSNVTKLEGVEGKVTAVSTDYIRVDGEKVFAAKNCDLNGQTLNLNATAVFYFDSYGNYIYVDKVAQAPERQPDGYAYVIGTQAQEATETDGDLIDAPISTGPIARAKIIDLTNNTTGVVDRAIVNDNGTWYYADKNGQKGSYQVVDQTYIEVNKVWAYYMMDDGSYAFEEFSSYSDSITVEKNASKLDGFEGYLTGSTVLKVITMDESFAEIVDVDSYTGYTNFPEETTGKGIVLAKDGKITEIILLTEEEEPKAETEQTYVVSKGFVEQDADGYHYSIYVPATGETVDFVSKTQEDNLKNDGTIVIFNINKDTKELVSFVKTATAAVQNEKIELLEETYMVVNGTAYEFAESYYVYGELEEGATVSVYTNEDGNVAFVNVIAQAEAAE